MRGQERQQQDAVILHRFCSQHTLQNAPTVASSTVTRRLERHLEMGSFGVLVTARSSLKSPG
jgi:hypothetical protein